MTESFLSCRRINYYKAMLPDESEQPISVEESAILISSIDFRPVETHHAISALPIYLSLIEEQMPVVQSRERLSLERAQPVGDNEEEEEEALNATELNCLGQLFEEELCPTMRYSFIVGVQRLSSLRKEFLQPMIVS